MRMRMRVVTRTVGAAMTNGGGHHVNTGAGNVAVRHKGRTLTMLSITRGELRALVKAGNFKTLSISLCTASAGVFATVLISVLSLPSLPDRALSIMYGLLLATGFLVVFFGWRSYEDWRAASEAADELLN